VSPDAGEKIGLQFQSHGKRIGLFFAGPATCSIDLIGNAQQFLHVMPNFVGDDIRLGKIARRLKALLQFVKETQVEINPFIFGQ